MPADNSICALYPSPSPLLHPHVCLHACTHRLPTLYLCECVLIYLEPAEAEAVLSTAAATAAQAGAPAAVAIYEQTRPDDAFGATMIRNLEVRTCSQSGFRQACRRLWGCVCGQGLDRLADACGGACVVRV